MSIERRDYGVKPIPTLYKGVKFKSRLEARWAVFYDYLEINWLYEYEGYTLKSGWYLPDFWLPGLDCWVEIKPTQPTQHEEELFFELSAATDKNVYCFFGMNLPSYEDTAHVYSYGFDNYQMWCLCPKCLKAGIEYEGRGERVCGDKCFPHSDKGSTGDHSFLIAAFKHALHYQFKY